MQKNDKILFYLPLSTVKSSDLVKNEYLCTNLENFIKDGCFKNEVWLSLIIVYNHLNGYPAARFRARILFPLYRSTSFVTRTALSVLFPSRLCPLLTVCKTIFLSSCLSHALSEHCSFALDILNRSNLSMC